MPLITNLTQSLLPALSIHILTSFHLLLLPSLSHYTLIVIIIIYTNLCSVIMIDEAHERNVNTDVLIGKRCLSLSL